MAEHFDSSNLMYVTKQYENDVRNIAKKIYADDEVRLTIENIDKQLNDILFEMNERLNFINNKITNPNGGVDAYIEGVHTQIDSINLDSRDLVDDGLEETSSHPSVMGFKSNRNSTKFNTYDFINKSLKINNNSPLLKFNDLNDTDKVHTFIIQHNVDEYLKIIEFSFTYKQYPTIYHKDENELLEEETVTITRVISGRFFVIWADPYNNPGKFIIKAIIENSDNTGNIVDKKIINVKELHSSEDLSVILDDGPQFDLYFTSTGNDIRISIGKIIPYRWAMRKTYINNQDPTPIENFSLKETITDSSFNHSELYYSKIVNVYFIVDRTNNKISYVHGGNKFGNSIALSENTSIPYNNEPITEFSLVETNSFVFVNLNGTTYISLTSIESFTELSTHIKKVYEVSTGEIIVLLDNGTFHLFNPLTLEINPTIFIRPKLRENEFECDYSLIELDNNKLVIFTSTDTGFSYKVKTINNLTGNYADNNIITSEADISDDVLTSLRNVELVSSTIKIVNNVFGIFVLTNHVTQDNNIISNVINLDKLIISDISALFKTVKVLPKFNYITKREESFDDVITDIKCTSLFMFGIGNTGKLFIIDSNYIVDAVKTTPIFDSNDGETVIGYSDAMSMLYLEEDEDADDYFISENPYLNNVIDIVESSNSIFIIDKNGVYELLDSKKLRCVLYTDETITTSLAAADVNSYFGIVVSKDEDTYRFYKNDYTLFSIPSEKLRYKYLDLFNGKYQKYTSDNVSDYDNETPIVKYNGILYISLVDHLSPIYNTNKINNIEYSNDIPYSEVKIQDINRLPFVRTNSDNTTTQLYSDFENKKFVLTTNKYGFKKYKDIIKLDDTLSNRISDINETKKYVIRNYKNSGINLETVSSNIIKLLKDVYKDVVCENIDGNIFNKTNKIIYKKNHIVNNATIVEKEDEEPVSDSEPDSTYQINKKTVGFAKVYNLAPGILHNDGSCFNGEIFVKLVETPVGCFIVDLFGHVYYADARKISSMISGNNVSKSKLLDITENNEWNYDNFVPVQTSGYDILSDKNTELYSFFDVKYIDTGHDTVILTCNKFTAIYDCYDPDTKEWTKPFSDQSKVRILKSPFDNTDGFTNILVDGTFVYLFDCTKESPIYKYNLLTNTFDTSLQTITVNSKVISINKIDNIMHVFAIENMKLVYFTINLISNEKTTIISDVKFFDGDNQQITTNTVIIKTYETNKHYFFYIIKKDVNLSSHENLEYGTLFKYPKEYNDEKTYKQVKLNGNMYFSCRGLTICKDLNDKYTIVGFSNKISNLPQVFIYNENTDIISALDINSPDELVYGFIDNDYIPDDGVIDVYPLHKFANGNGNFITNKMVISVYTKDNKITNSLPENEKPGIIHTYNDELHKYDTYCEMHKYFKFKNNLYSLIHDDNNNLLLTTDCFENNGDPVNINDIILPLLNNERYIRTTEQIPDINKEYYKINTHNMRFVPILNAISNSGIGYDVVFRRQEIGNEYVTVDTTIQKFPLIGVEYYTKNVNGNYYPVQNITKFEQNVKYYEKSHKFIPVLTESLIAMSTAPVLAIETEAPIQYYRSNNIVYHKVDFEPGEEFEDGEMYFTKETFQKEIQNIVANFFIENDELYLMITCELNLDNGSSNRTYVIKAKVLCNGISVIDIYNGIEYITNITSINETECMFIVHDLITNKDILVRSEKNKYAEWFSQYNEFSNYDNEKYLKIIPTEHEVFYSDIYHQKTYRLTDDKSTKVLLNNTYALDIFETESGIYGIALDTTNVFIYKYDVENKNFDHVIYGDTDNSFRQTCGGNFMFTMDDGFKAIFIMGTLNSKSFCYRIYKDQVSVYNDFNEEIKKLDFDNIYIYKFDEENIAIYPMAIEQVKEFNSASGKFDPSEDIERVKNKYIYLVNMINNSFIKRLTNIYFRSLYNYLNFNGIKEIISYKTENDKKFINKVVLQDNSIATLESRELKLFSGFTRYDSQLITNGDFNLKEMNNMLQSYTDTKFTCFYRDGSTDYAGTNQGLFRFREGSWNKETTGTSIDTKAIRKIGKSGNNFIVLVTDTIDDNSTLTFVKSNGTWVSTNYVPGNNVPINFNNFFIYGDIVIGIYCGGIFYSIDNGVNFYPTNITDSPVVMDSTFTIVNGIFILGLCNGNNDRKAIYYSEDNGKTWTSWTNGIQATHIELCTIDNIVIAAIDNYVYYSEDNCKTWISPYHEMAEHTFKGICVYGNKVYIGCDWIDGKTAICSEDYGKTWIEVGLNTNTQTEKMFVFKDYVIAITNNNSIVYFNNNSNTWKEYQTNLGDICSINTFLDEFYICGSTETYYSREYKDKFLYKYGTELSPAPIIDKDGDLYFANNKVNPVTGFYRTDTNYVAFDDDGVTVKHESIAFNYITITDDGLFGIKDGEIYLNKIYKDSNDFILVFKDTTYDLKHDILLNSDKFGLFYQSPNNKVYRWNGESFVEIFNTGNYNNIISFDRGQTIADISSKFNIKTIEINCLFYISEALILIELDNSDIYYYDIKDNSFKLLGNFYINKIFETSIGNIVITQNDSDYGRDNATNAVKLISYNGTSFITSDIDYYDKYLDGSNNNIIDHAPYYVLEDPVSNIIIVLSESMTAINRHCVSVILQTENGYKMIDLKSDSELYISLSNFINFDNSADPKSICNKKFYYKNMNKILLFNKATPPNRCTVAFNIEFTRDKKDLIMTNLDKIFYQIDSLFYSDSTLSEGWFFTVDKEAYIAANKKGIFKLVKNQKNEYSLELVDSLYDDFSFDDINCGISTVLWNDILFLMFIHDINGNRSTITLGKNYDRTKMVEEKIKSIGFDFTITLCESDKFNNLTESTEYSLYDKLVIKTTGIFEGDKISKLKSYIISNQRSKNLKEITSKNPTIFNLYKNIYNKINEKNLLNYRFNEIISKGVDALDFGYVEEILETEFNTLLSSILKVSSYNDTYRIDINVYPAIVDGTEKFEEMINFGSEAVEDLPDTNYKAYLPFDPFI